METMLTHPTNTALPGERWAGHSCPTSLRIADKNVCATDSSGIFLQRNVKPQVGLTYGTMYDSIQRQKASEGQSQSAPSQYKRIRSVLD